MLSVIIVTYNTAEMTVDCIKKVMAGKQGEIEVIVIDNKSSDQTVEILKKCFPKLKIITNETNAGFATANNQGMAIASGERFLLLNSDAFVEENTLEKLEQFLDAHPQASLVGGKLLNKDGSLQPSWGYFPTLRRVWMLMTRIDMVPGIKSWIDSIHVRDAGRYEKATPVDWVTGAVVMLKREVWERIGGIDEKYFMYGEEMEWMYRAKLAGFQTWYTPDAKAMHWGGASSTNRNPAILGEIKGWAYWFSKHYPAWQLPWLVMGVKIGAKLRGWWLPEKAEAYQEAVKQLTASISELTKSQ